MSSADITSIVSAVVALAGALAAYLRARTADAKGQQANDRIDAHETSATPH